MISTARKPTQAHIAAIVAAIFCGTDACLDVHRNAVQIAAGRTVINETPIRTAHQTASCSTSCLLPQPRSLPLSSCEIYTASIPAEMPGMESSQVAQSAMLLDPRRAAARGVRGSLISFLSCRQRVSDPFDGPVDFLFRSDERGRDADSRPGSAFAPRLSLPSYNDKSTLPIRSTAQYKTKMRASPGGTARVPHAHPESPTRSRIHSRYQLASQFQDLSDASHKRSYQPYPGAEHRHSSYDLLRERGALRL